MQGLSRRLTYPVKPSDLGLPPKFSAWRPSQESAILSAVCADERFVMINAPTGIGKSAIGFGIGSVIGGRTAYLTSTKPLQAQNINDFSSMGLVQVMGQNNYPCLYFQDGGAALPGRGYGSTPRNPYHKKLPGCEEGPCHAGIACDYRDNGCHYYDAVRSSLRRPYVTFNTAYWMSMARYAETGSLGEFACLVVDEAHDVATALANFVKVSLDRGDIGKLLSISPPSSTSIDEWVEWADQEALPLCSSKLEVAKTAASLHRNAISVVRRLRDLETRLKDLAKAKAWRRTDSPDPPAWAPGASTDWIIEEGKDAITFSPVWASGYAEDYLFCNIPKVILISATVTPQDAKYLGIPREQLTYLEFPSPFKHTIRPVYVIPGASVSRNMSIGEERVWVNRIDSIIEKEGEVKGIIHAVSYDRVRLILSRSRFKHLMVTHDRRSLRDTVDRFKLMKGAAVLVSPSVGTGYDFPLDQCRYQIIAKIPFIDNRSEVIRARAKTDKKYLDYVAMVALIQQAGRGVRSEQDFCRTYIIDDNWSRWFYPRNKKLVPKWFKRALRRIRSMEEVDGTNY